MENDTEARLTLITRMILELWENEDLAALNLALRGPKWIAKSNRVYELALNNTLIGEDGYPIGGDIILKALAHIIRERMQNGTFL